MIIHSSQKECKIELISKNSMNRICHFERIKEIKHIIVSIDSVYDKIYFYT